jgi:hypothetical protein
MNKDTIIALLLDGAYLDHATNRFYHPSFRKGYRAMRSTAISFMAAQRALGNKLQYDIETRQTRIN